MGFDPDKPLRIDATVTLKVERELDDYFGALDAASKAAETPVNPELPEIQ